MRKRKNSKVIHGDIFIITYICVLVVDRAVNLSYRKILGVHNK